MPELKSVTVREVTAMAPSALVHLNVGHGSEVLAPKKGEAPRQGGVFTDPRFIFWMLYSDFRREVCNTWAHDPSLPMALGKPLIL